MTTFVLTIDVPTSDAPQRDIAQILREVTPVVEYQMPLRDHHHVYGPNGLQKYVWQVEAPTDPGSPIDARRRP